MNERMDCTANPACRSKLRSSIPRTASFRSRSPSLNLTCRGEQESPSRGPRLYGREDNSLGIFQNMPSGILRNFGHSGLGTPLSQQAKPIENGTGIGRAFLTV